MARHEGAEHHKQAAQHHEHAARHHLEAAKHHEAGARMKRQDITLTLLTDTISTLPTTQRKRQNTMRPNMAISSSR